MLPFIIAGCCIAAGATLLAQSYNDYQIYRKRFGPWDHWTYRGRRIERGQRVFFPDTGESVKFTGRCVYIRDRFGHEDRVVIHGIGVTRDGRGYLDASIK